jgi:hypothetical protein
MTRDNSGGGLSTSSAPALVRGRHPSNSPRLALSIDEAAAALGISEDAFRAHVAPSIRLVRVGRRKVVAVRELERWLDDRGEQALERRSA